MKFCVDIDDTLLFSELQEDGTYFISSPNYELIEKTNKLYEEEHLIIVQTARHWDKLKETMLQLKEYNIKYHTLVMGNVTADVYINDKGVDPSNFLLRRNYDE